MTFKKKNNKKGGSRRPKVDDDGHVRIRSCFNQNVAVNTNTLVSALGNISTAISTGILASDVNVQSLTDIFRLFKINEIVFEYLPASATGAAAVQVPSGILGFVPFGTSANPTSMQDFESAHVSKPSVSYPTSTTTISAPLTRECGTTLALRNKDMPVLQGPGGGWLATQDDGTQGWYGKLFWAIAATTASNAMTYLLRTNFDLSFKDLLDPSLISKAMNRFPAGFPPSWQLQPDTPLYHAHQLLTSVPRNMPIIAKSTAAMVDTSEPQQSGLKSTGAQRSVTTTALSNPPGGLEGTRPYVAGGPDWAQIMIAVSRLAETVQAIQERLSDAPEPPS